MYYQVNLDNRISNLYKIIQIVFYSKSEQNNKKNIHKKSTKNINT